MKIYWWPQHDLIIMSFCQIFWESFISIYIFLYFQLFFVFKYNNSEEKAKAKNSYLLFSFLFQLFSDLVFYIMYLNTNKWIYNNVWLLNAIFTNKLQFHTNFRHFEYFVFNLWSSFSLSVLQDSYQQQLPHI